jgi:hypothetical protein
MESQDHDQKENNLREEQDSKGKKWNWSKAREKDKKNVISELTE